MAEARATLSSISAFSHDAEAYLKGQLMCQGVEESLLWERWGSDQLKNWERTQSVCFSVPLNELKRAVHARWRNCIIELGLLPLRSTVRAANQIGGSFLSLVAKVHLLSAKLLGYFSILTDFYHLINLSGILWESLSKIKLGLTAVTYMGGVCREVYKEGLGNSGKTCKKGSGWRGDCYREYCLITLYNKAHELALPNVVVNIN